MSARMPFAICRDAKCGASSYKSSTVGIAGMIFALVALLATGARAQQNAPQATQQTAQQATQPATTSNVQPVPAAAGPAQTYTPVEGDFVIRDFQFKSGETLPELRMHYTHARHADARRATAA